MYIYMFRKAPARQAAGGALSGVLFRGRLEGESPRGGEWVTAQRKAPYHVGVIFEKNVVLKSRPKNSGGKRGSMRDFSELWDAKGGQSGCFGVTFGTFFGDFLDYG